MRLEQSFDVDAPLERVWDALVDVEQVAPCLPGAAVTGRNEDGSYNGTLTIKIGPTTASYTGKLEMEQIDEAQRTATMQAQGTDKRGQGGAKATIVSRLVPSDGDGTRVEVSTDLHITGRLARFGRGGMMEDISDRMMKQFAASLQASLAGGGAPAPAAGPPPGPAGPSAAGESSAAWRAVRRRRAILVRAGLGPLLDSRAPPASSLRARRGSVPGGVGHLGSRQAQPRAAGVRDRDDVRAAAAASPVETVQGSKGLASARWRAPAAGALPSGR